jgi:hypothetical protein
MSDKTLSRIRRAIRVFRLRLGWERNNTVLFGEDEVVVCTGKQVLPDGTWDIEDNPDLANTTITNYEGQQERVLNYDYKENTGLRALTCLNCDESIGKSHVVLITHFHYVHPCPHCGVFLWEDIFSPIEEENDFGLGEEHA